MSYKGDLATRTSERLSDWAWADRVSPRTVMWMSAIWFAAVWALTIAMLRSNTEVETFVLILMIAPGNLIGLASLGHSSNDTPPDEWQQALRLKAFMWGGNLTLGLIGFYMAFAMGLADNAWFWQPQTENNWALLFFLAITTWMSITNFAAAWLTPSYAADLDEYE